MGTFALIDQAVSWWGERGVAEQLFYGIGLAAGIVAIILMILSVIGLEHDDVIDAMASGDVDHGGGMFSIKPLTGFFLGFGWVGGMSIANGASLAVATVLACAAGGVMMGTIVFMFRAIMGMKSNGTARIGDTVGAVGTVYLTLPPRKASGGQVTVSFRGRQETYAALQPGDSPVPAGEKVRVVAVVDAHTLLVEPHA